MNPFCFWNMDGQRKSEAKNNTHLQFTYSITFQLSSLSFFYSIINAFPFPNCVVTQSINRNYKYVKKCAKNKKKIDLFY